jgi:hypothetical protein
MIYTAQEVWEHRQKNQSGDLGDKTQSPYKLTFKFSHYELKSIPLKMIKFYGQNFENELNSSEDESCAKEYSLYQTEAPAIVVHFDGEFFHLIDGRHRVRSYVIKGLTEIKAFVGGC